MPLPLVPIAIGLLTTAAYASTVKRKPAALTPKAQAERAIVYETLINDVKDPAVLRKFSDAFREQGAIAEADMLLKRAMLRELPPEVKAERRAAFKKGMESRDPAAIRGLADAFESTGATGAAGSLRDYASALERGDVKPNPRIETEDSDIKDEQVTP